MPPKYGARWALSCPRWDEDLPQPNAVTLTEATGIWCCNSETLPSSSCSPIPADAQRGCTRAGAATSAELLQRCDPPATVTARPGFRSLVPPCPEPQPGAGSGHGRRGGLAAGRGEPGCAVGSCTHTDFCTALCWMEVGGVLLGFFLIHQSPVSWEDWTPELLQVKNSKSNIFLVVFLYSN